MDDIPIDSFRTNWGANKFMQRPLITNIAAMIFHDSNGSPKNMAELNIPNIGTSRVNGAIIVAGYLESNQLQALNAKSVDGYTM